MCNYPDNPWVQRANDYIAENRNNQTDEWHSVNFLLENNYCGINNRTTIENILAHLQSQGINLNREEFQQTILGNLKRKGIVATLVYPGTQGGVFIPCSEQEVKQAADQVLDRINSEVVNLAYTSRDTSFHNLFSLLSQIISWIKNNI
jgi:hypothetical protein